jgi:hypothetical protein
MEFVTLIVFEVPAFNKHLREGRKINLNVTKNMKAGMYLV